MSAKHLSKPDEEGVAERHVLNLSYGDPDAIGEIEQDTEADRGPGDDFRVAQHLVPQHVDRAAHEDDGDRRDHHVEAERPAQAPVPPPPTPADPAEDDLPEIAPKVDQHRRQRADMDRHVHDQPLVLPTGDERHEHQVPG